MLTPFYIARTIAAGASVRISTYGRHILIASISASTIQLSLDDDSPSRSSRGSISIARTAATRPLGCSTPGRLPRRCRSSFRKRGSIWRVTTVSSPRSRRAWSRSIRRSRLAAAAVAGQLADTVCVITPGPATLLFAANRPDGSRDSAPRTNGAGLIYLGIMDARAKAVDKFTALSAGEAGSATAKRVPFTQQLDGSGDCQREGVLRCRRRDHHHHPTTGERLHLK